MELNAQIQAVTAAIKNISGTATRFSEREPVAVVAQLSELVKHLESNIGPPLDWSNTNSLSYGFHVGVGTNTTTEYLEVEIPANATEKQEAKIVEEEYWDWAGNNAEFTWWKED